MLVSVNLVFHAIVSCQLDLFQQFSSKNQKKFIYVVANFDHDPRHPNEDHELVFEQLHEKQPPNDVEIDDPKAKKKKK